MSLVLEKPSEIMKRCTFDITKEQFYEFMWAREYELGPYFQRIEHIYRVQNVANPTSGAEVLCKLSNETEPHVKDFVLYPIYFDCCIQVIFSVVAFHIAPKDWQTYVPVGFETYRV